MSESQSMEISVDERFLFDLNGFLILRNVLSSEECAEYLEALSTLENRTYEDKWMETAGPGRPTRETGRIHQIRLNGLPRLHSIFDRLIDYPRILPLSVRIRGGTAAHQHLVYLQILWWRNRVAGIVAFPRQTIRIATVLSEAACSTLFSFSPIMARRTAASSRCPGSHKSNFDLTWRDYKGLELPGAIAVTGKAGDVLMFSETVIHDGLPKTTQPVRSNLYYNYVHAHYNVMTRERGNCHHFYFPRGRYENGSHRRSGNLPLGWN